MGYSDDPPPNGALACTVHVELFPKSGGNVTLPTMVSKSSVNNSVVVVMSFNSMAAL